jgi:hypothetical protein
MKKYFRFFNARLAAFQARTRVVRAGKGGARAKHG